MYCSTHPNTEELFQTVLTAYTKAVGSQGYFELILLNVRMIDWKKLMKSMKCLSIKLFSMKYWLIWNWLNWLEWINLIWAHLNQFKSPSIHKILTHIVLFHVILMRTKNYKDFLREQVSIKYLTGVRNIEEVWRNPPTWPKTNHAGIAVHLIDFFQKNVTRLRCRDVAGCLGYIDGKTKENKSPASN